MAAGLDKPGQSLPRFWPSLSPPRIVRPMPTQLSIPMPQFFGLRDKSPAPGPEAGHRGTHAGRLRVVCGRPPVLCGCPPGASARSPHISGQYQQLIRSDPASFFPEAGQGGEISPQKGKIMLYFGMIYGLIWPLFHPRRFSAIPKNLAAGVGLRARGCSTISG